MVTMKFCGVAAFFCISLLFYLEEASAAKREYKLAI